MAHSHLWLHVNTNPPSQMKLMREIGFLMRYKAARLSEPSPSFFEDSGEVLKSVNKTPGVILVRGTDP